MKLNISLIKLWRLLFCCMLAIVAISCTFTSEYYIEQDIAAHGFKTGAFLKTKVWHKGEIIKSWYDEVKIDTPNTIKCYRLMQAMEFVKKCKSFDDYCNNH